MATFAELSSAFLAEIYADSPVMATDLGVEGYDDQLDDLSEAAVAQRQRRRASWLDTFAGLDDAALTPAERIDRDLVVATLRGQAVMDDWVMWRRQPDTYMNPGLDGVFALFLHRLKPEAELVRCAVARLRQVPRLLADGQRNLAAEVAPTVYVERGLGQARAGARYLRELVPEEVADPALRSRLAEAGAAAGAAFDDYAGFLQRLLDSAHGDWAIGEQRYSRLLRDKELLPYDAGSLRERGRHEYERLAGELRRGAQAIAGTDDWPRVLAAFSQDHPRTPEAMRQSYADWTERARQFLKDHGLASFPAGEECLVEPSPLYQRPVLAVASYESPPPFSRSLTGHFFVPFPPDGAPEAEVQQRLENNSYPSIPTTAVHETYPGHHWHLVTAQSQPSAVRRTFRTPFFSEGWALYAEQVMREEGFFTDPRQEMSQYEATLFRAARVVVDTSLHMGEMTFDQAVRFMVERANLPLPTARAEVGRYCSWPTQASSYLTGLLEILRIRDRYLAAGGSLRAFHDTMAGSGGLPLALAERAVLGE